MGVTITVSGGSIAEIIAALSTASTSTVAHPMAGTQGPFILDDDADDGAPLNTNAPAVDSDGVPWDQRIHSDNRQTTAKGVWRKRKNIDDATYKSVTAELKARGNPQMSFTPPTGGMPTIPMMPAGQMQQPVFTPPVSMPGQPPAFSPQPAASGMAFSDFMPAFSAAIQAGKIIPQQDFQMIYSWLGITDIGQLASQPDKTLQLFQFLQQNGKI